MNNIHTYLRKSSPHISGGSGEKVVKIRPEKIAGVFLDIEEYCRMTSEMWENVAESTKEADACLSILRGNAGCSLKSAGNHGDIPKGSNVVYLTKRS